MADLKGAQQALVEQFMRRQAGDILAIQINPARVGREQAGDDVKQRGLAGPVRADQTGNGTARDLQAYAIDRGKAAEALVRLANGDDVILQAPAPPCLPVVWARISGSGRSRSGRP